MQKSLFSLLAVRRFLPLFATQFLGAFNDNFVKSALVILATYRVASDAALDGPYVTVLAGETPERRLVRFRTVGDASCTGAVESTAATVHDVIAEIAITQVTERGATRADDRASEAAMEDHKKEGYF